MTVVLAAVTVLLLPLPAAASVVGLALIGFGNGSIYPNLIYLTPHNFGKETSQAVMGSLIAFAYIGVMLAPPIVGLVTGLCDITSYPIILASIFAIMAISLAVFVMQLKRHKRFDTSI